MLFITVEDFMAQASGIPRLSREEEKALAQRMASGDRTARETLVYRQLPLVASFVQRAPSEIRTLRTVYACIAAVEKSVDSFNFLQDSDPFINHLARSLRQCITRCLAYRFE